MRKDLYDFSALKQYLRNSGYNVSDKAGYVAVKPDDVFDMQGKTPISFIGNDGQVGIFATDKNGVKRQVFMYKYRYHLGYGEPPRFHICNCKVIDSFMKQGRFGEYHYANTDEVDVYDLDSHQEKVLTDLPLCGYCTRQVGSLYNVKNTTQFVEILKQAGMASDNQAQEVDIFGYVKDWEAISKAYRELHEYKCEKCGYDGSSLLDRMFMHTHHKDGNKLNNNESNLQCLCIKCHSEVDQTHRRNFSEGDKAKQLEGFRIRYIRNNTFLSEEEVPGI